MLNIDLKGNDFPDKVIFDITGDSEESKMTISELEAYRWWMEKSGYSTDIIYDKLNKHIFIVFYRNK